MPAAEMKEKPKPAALPAGKPGDADPLTPHRPLSEALARLYGGRVAIEEAPGAVGEFGHARTNPVPTSSLEESLRYLGRLRLPDGESVSWRHSATIAVGLNGKPVFQYAIVSEHGRPVATLYLSPAYAGTSTKAPRGFTLDAGKPAA